MKLIVPILVVMACLILLTLHCSTTNLAGGTIETTNGYAAGCLLDSAEMPIPNARVTLVPASYDPYSDGPLPDSLSDTTDHFGRYLLHASGGGIYNIEAKLLVPQIEALVTGIDINSNDTIHIPITTLRRPGAIRIVLAGGGDTTSGYVYIPGTTIFAPLTNREFVILAPVPTRTILSLNYAVKSLPAVSRTIDSVVAGSGDTTTVSYYPWTLSKKLYVNTTTSGAGVSGNVLNFPVLVRLTNSNFDFSQAKSGGEDIRFAKFDGALLSYEIERWDATKQAGEIWVKVDTIFGNDSSHFINMYWGNPNATSESNGKAVFDTAQGNLGVWHLGQNLSDATGNGDNGIDSSTADAAGIIGQCRHFNPTQRSFITIPNKSRFDLTANITLSAWVLVDSFIYQWHTIVAKGDGSYRLHCDTVSKVGVLSLTTADTANFGYQDAHGKTVINDRQWHLLTGVFDGTVMRMYTDGILESEVTAGMPCLTDSLNVTIGDNRARSPRFFSGSIDEVRIMHTPMNGDWVKLCYMNQKQSDALIVFK